MHLQRTLGLPIQPGRAAIMNQQASDPRVGLAHHRTSMAKFRTQLALDRTTLAWIRTTVTMAAFGFGTVEFFRAVRERSSTPESIHLHRAAIVFGSSLVVVGIISTVSAGISHWRTLRRLRRDEEPVLSQWPLSITVAMLLAVVGLVSLGLLLHDVWPTL
jgi:uncharacterized membrane protein YidH (DUF202 family)